MRASWNWLAEWVDLSGLTADEVSRSLTTAGIEVEGIERLDRGLELVVVARIVEAEPHPGADKLRVCQVDDGSGTLRQVVCGAPNAAAGCVVPLALPGARIPNGLEVQPATIRGVASHGMLCSAKELGLGDDHGGLMILDEALVIGSPFAAAVGLDEVVFELSVTPNRADCLSIVGLAKEISACMGRSLRAPAASPLLAVTGAATASFATVEVADAEGCSRYAAIVAHGVKVAPSPLWMQRRLQAVGQRPVSNLVDLTNYILFEQGQPLHAFDLAELQGRKVVVRTAQAGELLETLDGSARQLVEGDLVICDAARPIALAGVMGGANTEISDGTTSVLIEVAHFDRMRVRRTAKRLKMRSEASYRFERGVDPHGIPAVVERTIALLAATQQECGAAPVIASEPIDLIARPIAPQVIDYPIAMTARVLGMEVSAEKVRSIFGALGFSWEERGAVWQVTVPPRRSDVERPIDLVEEIGRLVGFDALPATLPEGRPGEEPVRREGAPVPQEQQPIQTRAQLALVEAARDTSVRLGWSEAVNWGFGEPAKLTAVTGQSAFVTLSNPLSAEQSVMRTTLLAGLLGNVAHNLARGGDRVALFELGARFPEGGESEPMTYAAVATGERARRWAGAGERFDAHDMTGLVDAVGVAIGRPLRFVPVDGGPAWLHPAARAAVLFDGEIVGHVGRLHPATLDAFDLGDAVFACELDLAALAAKPAPAVRFARMSRTQDATRDVALLLDASIPFATVQACVAGLESGLVESVRLFDVYAGDRLAEGKRSLALRVTYRSPEATLTDAEIEVAHQAVVERLTSELGASTR
jgi:phenylalanyl-tRNA synthetase beta chain